MGEERNKLMKYEAYIDKIDKYLKENRQGIIDDLSALVKIPSVTADDAACNEALEETCRLFDREGAHLSNKKYYAVGSWGEGEEDIGIFAHADVVAAEGEWLTGNAFEPKYQNGCLIGRGSEDNKSGIIAALYAMRAIRDLDIPLKKKLTFVIGSSEETGMDDMEAYVKNEKMPTVSLVPDGSFPLHSGEKGIMRFMLKSKRKLDRIRKFEGGSCYNIILERAEAQVDYSDVFLKKLKEKASDKLTVDHDGKTIYLSAKGKAKHAAMPEGSENAAGIIARALADCYTAADMSWDRHILNDAAKLVDKYYGEELEIDNTDEVFGKLTCANGIVRLEDGHLKLSFDIRYGTSFDAQEAVKKIAKVTDHLWEIEELSVDDGYNFPKDDKGAAALLEVYRKVSGDGDACDIKSSGGTYARNLKNAYTVSTVVDYIKGGLDLPEGHGGIHQPDEYINIDSLTESVKIIVCMILALDETV